MRNSVIVINIRIWRFLSELWKFLKYWLRFKVINFFVVFVKYGVCSVFEYFFDVLVSFGIVFYVVVGYCRLGDRDSLGVKNIKIIFVYGVNLIV